MNDLHVYYIVRLPTIAWMSHELVIQKQFRTVTSEGNDVTFFQQFLEFHSEPLNSLSLRMISIPMAGSRSASMPSTTALMVSSLAASNS